MIEFIVYGEPVAQGRPKTAVVQGRAIVYDPKKSSEFKRDVKVIAQVHVPDELLTGPLEMTIKIYRPIPQSMSQTKREQALREELLPAKKPDLKNYVAGIEDALEGVLYVNDSQIVRYGTGTGKYYGDPPRIEVGVKQL